MRRYFYRSELAVAVNVNRRWQFGIVAREGLELLQTDRGILNEEANGVDYTGITIYTTTNLDRSGLFPRGVVCRPLVGGVGPAIEEKKIFIPIFSTRPWARMQVGDTIDFFGETVIIISKRSEILRS